MLSDIACARLLALLFPECRSMVQVKQAAETARTKYTETKAVLRSNSRRSTQDPFDPSAFAEQNDPPLPLVLKEGIRNLILDKEDLNMAAASDEKTAASLAIRQLSRKKQLDALVEKALQNVNERDEEGRSLPEELTADDVGRTLLRRAEPSDMRAIKKLLAEETPESSGRRSHSWETDFSGSEEEPFFNMSCVWSPTSIVLLLCRAIAAYEDPPLGCAVLTVDFSMEEGRILRAARIANEPHLPQERFIECLQDFAESLNYKLETTVRSDDKAKRWRVADAKSIVKSYVSEKSECKPRSIHQGTLPLQSVQEESEASDSSNAERRPAKSRSKPSKRSRFQ